MSTALWSPSDPPSANHAPSRLLVGCLGIGLAAILACVGVPLALWYFSSANTMARRVTDAQLPYVELVDYNLNPIYPAESVAIYLTADVTDAQVIDLYCRIVTPAAAAQLNPWNFLMIKGVHWFPPSHRPQDGDNYSFTGGTTVEPPACP